MIEFSHLTVIQLNESTSASISQLADGRITGNKSSSPVYWLIPAVLHHSARLAATANGSPFVCLIISLVINVIDGFNIGLLMIYVRLARSCAAVVADDGSGCCLVSTRVLRGPWRVCFRPANAVFLTDERNFARSRSGTFCFCAAEISTRWQQM